jgi:hypothetical protein
MQPAQLANQLMSRPQIEMIGIAEQDLTTYIGQIARQHGLHRPLSSHRHEAGRLHLAMRRDQPA